MNVYLNVNYTVPECIRSEKPTGLGNGCLRGDKRCSKFDHIKNEDIRGEIQVYILNHQMNDFKHDRKNVRFLRFVK